MGLSIAHLFVILKKIYKHVSIIMHFSKKFNKNALNYKKTINKRLRPLLKAVNMKGISHEFFLTGNK